MRDLLITALAAITLITCNSCSRKMYPPQIIDEGQTYKLVDIRQKWGIYIGQEHGDTIEFKPVPNAVHKPVPNAVH